MQTYLRYQTVQVWRPRRGWPYSSSYLGRGKGAGLRHVTERSHVGVKFTDDCLVFLMRLPEALKSGADGFCHRRSPPCRFLLVAGHDVEPARRSSALLARPADRSLPPFTVPNCLIPSHVPSPDCPLLLLLAGYADPQAGGMDAAHSLEQALALTQVCDTIWLPVCQILRVILEPRTQRAESAHLPAPRRRNCYEGCGCRHAMRNQSIASTTKNPSPASVQAGPN